MTFSVPRSEKQVPFLLPPMVAITATVVGHVAILSLFLRFCQPSEALEKGGVGGR